MGNEINHSWWTKMARMCLHKHNFGWKGKDYYGMYEFCMMRKIISKIK